MSSKVSIEEEGLPTQATQSRKVWLGTMPWPRLGEESQEEGRGNQKNRRGTEQMPVSHLLGWPWRCAKYEDHRGWPPFPSQRAPGTQQHRKDLPFVESCFKREPCPVNHICWRQGAGRGPGRHRTVSSWCGWRSWNERVLPAPQVPFWSQLYHSRVTRHIFENHKIHVC